MKKLCMKCIPAFFLILSVSFSNSLFAQETIRGIITEGSSGEALIGANVVLAGVGEGTVTDFDGRFEFTVTQDFPVSITISYLGYETLTLRVENSEPLDIKLASEGILTDEVIVTASRRAEKLQEAPAAVSVVRASEISSSGGAIAPVRALINTPGVELQQQTGQRINIALRGSSGVFSTSVFPMLDYRSLISPGLELFDSQNSPINNIDVERIEVVLGPGSALYGPDVTSGVVHFISKDPFRYAGTTTELVYGERSTFKAAMRHAGHSENQKFGYKINARYGSGDDFTLDPDDPSDAGVLSTFQNDIRRGTITPEGFVNPQVEGPVLLSPGKVQKPDYWSAAVNGQIHIRPDDHTAIVGAGGWNAGSSIFYNELGEGITSSNEYWGQVRLHHKGLFAQTYYIVNDGGSDDNPVYLNRTGLIVPLERTHFEGQVQYNFEIPSFFDSEWTAGVDFRNATANTENHVYGRNEDDDDYRILGTYIQTKMALGDKVDLFLAGRYDTYNFTDEETFSPRAAIVYKPNQYNSIRLSYNRAADPIASSDIYFDLPVQTTPVFNVWNLGGIRPQTFGDSPTIDWIIPGVPNTPFSAGFPLSAAYQAVNADVIAGIEDLGSQDPTLAPFVPLLVQLLQSDAPDGFSSAIASTDLNGNELLPVDVSTKLLRHVTAFELGYKGLFFDKWAAGLDLYYFRNTKGGGFDQVSPIITLTNLAADLGQSVQTTFQPQIEGFLIQNGFDAATAAALAGQVGAVLNGAYTQGGQGFLDALTAAGLPFHGIVPTEQVPNTGFPHLAFGYPTRNPDEISDDWGFEFHTKYYFSENFTAFGNYTWFNNPNGQPGDLNFPQNKFRIGLNYGPEIGFKGSLSFQWDQEYTSNNSTYPGKIDARELVDMTVGYGFENGLTLEASATNMLDNKFRALPGFPVIGRTATVRALLNF